jgi:type II secretory pathway component PulM
MPFRGAKPADPGPDIGMPARARAHVPSPRLYRRLIADDPEARFAAAAIVAFTLLAITYWAFVGTEVGQNLENLAVRGAELRREAAREASLERLTQISVVTFAIAIAAAFAIGLVRRRPALATVVAVVMVLSVVLAELLKELLPRPALVPGPAWILRNSFPSGSAAVATAIAVGTLLVAPDRLRWAVLPVGALFAAAIGDAIQTTGWHRLSDTVGSALLVIAVASTALVVLARLHLIQPSPHGRVHPRVRDVLTALALVALVVGTVMLVLVVAFPLLGSPEGGRRAFLQTAFPLFGAGLTILALVAFMRVIEPFSLGQTQASDDPIRSGMAGDPTTHDAPAPSANVGHRNAP